jgi:UDPglucose--hexose-1-phosphate uridylyltransferase
VAERPAGELRFDPLTREWVDVVGHRQGRPNLPTDACPFCPGGLEAPEPYDVAWFENRWPALAPGAPLDLPVAEAAGIVSLPAVGACEVVLFSPEHDQSLATLGRAGVRAVVDLWAARTAALLTREEIEYVLVFENRGRAVGATIDHPHGQIYGYPFVPPVPAQEAAVARAHGCAVCLELRAETAAASRVVFDGDGWVAWVPYASGQPFGVRAAPRAHVGTLDALDAAGRDGLAAALVDVLGRYDRLWAGDPGATTPFPYLLWFHQAPSGGGTEHHVHLHLAPPERAPGILRYVASGELGSGTLSNPVLPEAAAAALRRASHGARA